MKNLKKIAVAFSLLAIIFASCSTDGTSGNSEQQPKITAVYNARSAATATEDGAKVVLAWNNPSSGYYGAALSIAPAAGSLATPKTLGASETTCTVTGLAADTSYVFTWKNLDSSGNETTTSVSLTVKTPEAGTKELTQAELQALLDADSKENIYEQILAGKTAAALLEKLSTEQKGALFDEMAKDETFLNRLTQEQKDAVSDGASEAKKAEIFDSLLASKTNVDFVKEILNKEGNETLRKSVKDYLVGELTQAELQALLDATDTTAPNNVTNLAAQNLGEAVKLTWTDATDTDILAYEITYTGNSASRAVSFEANSIVIPQGTGNAVIANLTNGKTYTFTVKTVDKIGNKSAGQTVDCEVKALPASIENAGTYNVYHYQQKTTGGKTFADYELSATDNSKVVAKGATVETLKKIYDGFTVKSMTVNDSAIYIMYDRNTITYTFETGTEGKFDDKTTSKTVSGLFGASYTKPKSPTSGDYNFSNWQTSEGVTAPNVFGAEDTTFIAVWTPIPEGFVKLDGVEIVGTETWTPSSSVFVSGRAISIPTLMVCDHEVTRGEFKEVFDTDPSIASAYDENGNELTGDDVLNNPVNYVNWYAAIAYCNKKSAMEGLELAYTISGITYEDWKTFAYSSIPTESDSTWDEASCNFKATGYRLPTEAEWEYLARGGQNYTYAGSDTVGDVAWYTSNTNNTGSRTVKTKAANGYGLYDMSGNVYEWCWDWYGSISASSAADGAASSSSRVLRGGSWHYSVSRCEVANRDYCSPDYRSNHCGFRVVRSSSN